MAVTLRAATPTDAGALAVLLTQLGYPSTEQDVLARLEYWAADPYSQVLLLTRMFGWWAVCRFMPCRTSDAPVVGHGSKAS
jgi:hypothetical protein